MSESDEGALSPGAAAAQATRAEATRAKNVNLFFGSRSELTEVSRKDDASTAYIIFQNDRLHAQVERLQRRLKEMERDLNRASDDTDRAERSRTCLRGMLHNEIEKGRIMTDVNARLRKHRDSLAGGVERTSMSSGANMMVALGAHALAWMWPDGALDSFGFAVHMGNAAVLGWMCYRAMARADREARAAASALAELNEQLAAATRGTEHLHDIVDEL